MRQPHRSEAKYILALEKKIQKNQMMKHKRLLVLIVVRYLINFLKLTRWEK